MFARLAIQLTVARGLAAAAAMAAVSWSVITAAPLPLLVYFYLNQFCLHRKNDLPWVAPIVLACSFLGAGLGSAVLRMFKQKLTTKQYALLAAVNLVCVVIAAARMWAYVDAHPPEA